MLSSDPATDRDAALRACIEELNHTDPADVCDASLQQLIAAAVRVYSNKVERFGGFPVVSGGSLTATDAMIATTALLKAVNVQVFELGCWQNWAG
jgi:hypothetical protein